MIALHRLPMFGFFGLGFLLFCAVIAVAVWVAVRSGERGTTKLGGLAGCAIALALLVVAGMGAIGCTAIALLNAPNEVVERGPVKSFELSVEEDGAGSELAEDDPDADGAVHLRFELSGVDAGQVTRWIRDHTESDVPYTISTVEDGDAVRLDVVLPISRDDLEEFREDFRRDFPDLKLPVRLKVELRRDD